MKKPCFFFGKNLATAIAVFAFALSFLLSSCEREEPQPLTINIPVNVDVPVTVYNNVHFTDSSHNVVNVNVTVKGDTIIVNNNNVNNNYVQLNNTSNFYYSDQRQTVIYFSPVTNVAVEIPVNVNVSNVNNNTNNNVNNNDIKTTLVNNNNINVLLDINQNNWNDAKACGCVDTTKTVPVVNPTCKLRYKRYLAIECQGADNTIPEALLPVDGIVRGLVELPTSNYLLFVRSYDVLMTPQSHEVDQFQTTTATNGVESVLNVVDKSTSGDWYLRIYDTNRNHSSNKYSFKYWLDYTGDDTFLNAFKNTNSAQSLTLKSKQDIKENTFHRLITQAEAEALLRTDSKNEFAGALFVGKEAEASLQADGLSLPE